MNKDFEEFGEQRLESALHDAQPDCQQTMTFVKSQVAAFVDDAEQSDDITLLALRRL